MVKSVACRAWRPSRVGLDGAELANPNGYGGVPDDCYESPKDRQ
jgi:hypothetical protein